MTEVDEKRQRILEMREFAGLVLDSLFEYAMTALQTALNEAEAAVLEELTHEEGTVVLEESLRNMATTSLELLPDPEPELGTLAVPDPEPDLNSRTEAYITSLFLQECRPLTVGEMEDEGEIAFELVNSDTSFEEVLQEMEERGLVSSAFSDLNYKVWDLTETFMAALQEAEDAVAAGHVPGVEPTDD